MFRIDAIDLGPDSLLWRWSGDNRLSFTGLPTGILQLMLPGLGAGVEQHSAFFTEPWDRIERSVPEIIGVVYDGPEAEATGHRVRDHHRRIKGVDAQGRSYSALSPETFWWAHATFQFAVERLVDRFDSHQLTDAEREQLYREGIEWYRRYGVSMQPVPPTRTAFAEKWSRICAEELEMTASAERAIDMSLHSKIDDLPGLPEWSRPLQRHVVTPILKLSAIGGLPASVRARFDIPFSALEAAEFTALQRSIRQMWRFAPRSVRWAPRASEGWRRAARRRRDEEFARAAGALLHEKRPTAATG